MDKSVKTIIIVVFLCIVGYFGFFILQSVIYGYRTDWNMYNKYTYLLKDSVKNNLDYLFCSSEVGYNDVNTSIWTKDSVRISVWEFNELKDVDLKQVQFREDVNLESLRFNRGVILDSKSDMNTTVEYGFTFDNSLVVSLDQYSKIQTRFEEKNYRGFFGYINKLSLSNGITHKHYILLNYALQVSPALVLFYKDNKGFYMIIVDSKKGMDEKIIRVLNLK
jgi:hypothetical protein